MSDFNGFHDFNESLKGSHAAADLPFWREAYEKAFPGMRTMIDHRQDGHHQREGIDRSIILANAKQVLVDEKVRWRNRKTGLVYQDIALEFLSDRDRGVPGWVCKPIRADYIAYAIAPLGRCYLMPVLQLQHTWLTWGKQWKQSYPVIEAHNRDGRRCWVTLSVCVPPLVLFPEMAAALWVDFTPLEESASGPAAVWTN